MRSLFDVNVLLAMLDADHIHHPRVRAWWADHRGDGWASCPLTQLGFLRIVAQPSYARIRPLADAIVLLKRATARADHAFWPDDLSMLDATVIDHTRVLGPRQLADIYLLALATKHGGRLITLDTGIPRAAVPGSKESNMVML
ncbi:MAG: PIN domain-containing protein [Hyphomicrobiaceae bacterium]|nr:PIN domain-containing protein [Hyphomicrobiaceae bacterium]